MFRKKSNLERRLADLEARVQAMDEHLAQVIPAVEQHKSAIREIQEKP